MLICLILSQRSLKNVPIKFVSFCCSDWVIYIIIFSISLTCSISSGLLLILSVVFLISVIVSFKSVWFFLIFSNSLLKFLLSLSILLLSSVSIFMIIAFNSLLDKLCLVAQLCPTLCDPMDCSPPGSSVHGDSSGKNTGVGFHTLLQGIFPTQALNPGLPHCRQILYRLSHQGSPLDKLLISISLGIFSPRVLSCSFLCVSFHFV